MDRVAGTDVALAHDAEVGAHASLVLKALRESEVVHANAELEAGKSRLCDLEDRRADLPVLADDRLPEVDAFDGEILAELARRRHHAVVVPPCVVVLARVGVDGLVRSAVHLAIGLVVAVEVDAADRDAAIDRVLPDRRRDDLSSPEHLADRTDVDGQHAH
jgi:hypothetical protein